MADVLTLDTNFVQALLQDDHVHHPWASEVVANHSEFVLTICSMVYCKALSIPDWTAPELEAFYKDLGIQVDWGMPPVVWRQAGLARAEHLRVRSKGENKRFIADFLIGVFAELNGYYLATFDPKGFRTAYPNIKLLP